jgi:hypothetical protein
MLFVSLLVLLDKEVESGSQFSLENSLIFFYLYLQNFNKMNKKKTIFNYFNAALKFETEFQIYFTYR